ncbi:MAG TPA: DUF4129 domain-containing protein [Acidimicrobiales bacterium]|nr:DUF4129 domain-containing protein [Acidimicrobiales bacterium]
MLAAAPPPDVIRDRADEILGQPEFARHQSVLERVLDWIGDQLSRFSFGVGGGPGFVGALIGLMFLAGAIVLVVMLVRSIRRVPRRPEPEPELSVEEVSRRSAAAWRTDAERFEAEQQWREAMRARYRELVRTLVDERVLADIAGRTTGEYDRELVAARPAAADAFSELTGLFEAVWYGGQPATAEQHQRFRSLVGDVRDRTRARSAVRAETAGVP